MLCLLSDKLESTEPSLKLLSPLQSRVNISAWSPSRVFLSLGGRHTWSILSVFWDPLPITLGWLQPLYIVVVVMCVCVHKIVCMYSWECRERFILCVWLLWKHTSKWVCKNTWKWEMAVCVRVHVCVVGMLNLCQLFSHLQAWGVLGNSQGCWFPAPATLSSVPSLAFWEPPSFNDSHFGLLRIFHNLT